MKAYLSILLYLLIPGIIFAEVPTRPEITGTFHENYYGRTNEDASFKNVSTLSLTTHTLGVGTSEPTHQTHFLLRGDDNIFIDGRTNERLITVGATQILHTAGTNGTRAINIDVDTNNQFDTHAINVNYVANGVVTGDYNHIYDLHLDLANSTGGEIAGFACSQTGSGLADMGCLDVYPGVDPVEHHSGTLTNAEAAFTYDGAFTNVTSAFSSDSNNVPVFSNNGDYVYFGNSVKFDDIEVNLDTFADGSGIKPLFEFSAGASSWTPFSPTDGSNGFRQNGNVRWLSEPLVTWTTDTVNGVADKYWVRVQRNQNNTTTPIEKTLKITSSVIYSWNSDGIISNSGVNTGYSNQTTISSSGDLNVKTPAQKTLKLDTSVWKDINASANDLGVGAVSPSRLNIASTTIKTYSFLGTSAVVDELHGSTETPHDYREGTDIYPHIHSAPTTADLGNFKWGLEYIWEVDGDTITTSTSIFGISTSAGAWSEQTTPMPPMDGTGHLTGDRIGYRIFRDPADGSDTYAAPVALFDLGFHYEVDTLGSRQELIK